MIFRRNRYAALYEYVQNSDSIELQRNENKYLLGIELEIELDLDNIPEKGDKIYFPDTDRKLEIIDIAIGVDGKTYYWLEPKFDEDCDIAKQSYMRCAKERDEYRMLKNEDK